jgi:DinB superfamily
MTKRARTRGGASRAATRSSSKKKAVRRAQATAHTRAKASKRVKAALRARAKSAPKRTKSPARKSASTRSGLKLMPRPTPPAFPQSTDGSAKQRLVFELLRARTQVMAALQGLSAGSGERPLAPGKWTVREVVLHLVARDRARLREMEAALLGRRGSWIGQNEAANKAMNENDLMPLRHHDWDQSLRLLQSTRMQLMEAVEAVPDQPAGVWLNTHPFGEMMLKLGPHDRHHAEALKRWRAPGDAPKLSQRRDKRATTTKPTRRRKETT